MKVQPEGARLILASASVTRRTLLEAAGLRPEISPVSVDEASLREAAQAEGASAEAAALMLAAAKAARVRAPGALVIGVDQILVQGETWFGKAPTLEAARAQLVRLRGTTHHLATAVVAMREGETVWQHAESPALTMRRFSDRFLEVYLAGEGRAILGSVGCYRLEGPGIHLFERVVGDHATILGLPLLPLLGYLRQAGVVIG
jgi:septum formation protein